jgi:hypothetical protein
VEAVWLNGKFPMFAWLNSVRFLRCVGGEKIRPRNFKGLATLDGWKTSQVDGQVHRIGGFAIEHKKNDLALTGVMEGGRDHVINRSCGFGVAVRRLNLGLKDAPPSMLGDELKGMKDRLAPSCSTRLRKNRGNDID